ncbi:phosphodiesterase [Plakobranchus ocellatus]|uniref:Phosphodiesterase n=1 Tax=Plakobranchus ocellatus TaxID=259542 RepID=A0AAV4C5I3_9GAST|nr:phosphodiesterase [Plakobranchus ocellatus]
MLLQQKTMSILLVFGREDSQSDGFWWAAEHLSYRCTIARTPENALEAYLSHHHDVVIIDARQSNYSSSSGSCATTPASSATSSSADSRTAAGKVNGGSSSAVSTFDAEALCRSIKATKASLYTVLVAVTKKPAGNEEEPSVLPLLKAGFTRAFTPSARPGRRWRGSSPRHKGPWGSQGGLANHCATDALLDGKKKNKKMSRSNRKDRRRKRKGRRRWMK